MYLRAEKHKQIIYSWIQFSDWLLAVVKCSNELISLVRNAIHCSSSLRIRNYAKILCIAAGQRARMRKLASLAAGIGLRRRQMDGEKTTANGFDARRPRTSSTDVKY